MSARPYALPPLFTPDLKGPDGQGRNRFRLEVTEPRWRCSLRPTDPVTIWTNSNRPDHRESGNYGPCRAATCQGCSFATPPTLALTAPVRVTEDEQDRVTLHTEPPRTFSGWSAFYRAVRCELGMVRRDEHGWHYPAYPVPDHA